MTRNLTIAGRLRSSFGGQALALVLLMSAASRAMSPLADHAAPPAAPLTPQQGQTLGPARCLNCHDHSKEDQWYKTREMAEVQRLFADRGAQAGHINSMNQLESPKSKDFLRAVGQTDAYDVKGKCVACHATVINGEADAGVSCESCHGPAGGYLDLHQRTGSYQKAVAAGMIPLVGNIDKWAAQCQSCHILTDQRLIAAKHPSGKDFDLSVKFQPVSLHFKSKRYSPGEVSAAWARLRPTPAPPPPPPPVTPTLSPSPTVTTPVKIVEPNVPPVVVTTPKPTTPSPPPPKPPPVETTKVTPTIAPAVPAAPPPAQTDPAPRPIVVAPSMALSAVQGRVISALTQLLGQGTTVPTRVREAPAPVPYNGPDAALLQLQAEAIALALQVLGQPPPKTRGGGL